MARIVPEGGFNLKPIKTPRVEKKSHLAFIRGLPCVCCSAAQTARQDGSSDPAHVRMAAPWYGKEYTGKAEKPSDRWTLPLCRQHHDKQHATNEESFWESWRIDAPLLALILWGLTGDEHEAIQVINRHARGR